MFTDYQSNQNHCQIEFHNWPYVLYACVVFYPDLPAGGGRNGGGGSSTTYRNCSMSGMWKSSPTLPKAVM